MPALPSRDLSLIDGSSKSAGSGLFRPRRAAFAQRPFAKYPPTAPSPSGTETPSPRCSARMRSAARRPCSSASSRAIRPCRPSSVRCTGSLASSPLLPQLPEVAVGGRVAAPEHGEPPGCGGRGSSVEGDAFRRNGGRGIGEAVRRAGTLHRRTLSSARRPRHQRLAGITPSSSPVDAVAGAGATAPADDCARAIIEAKLLPPPEPTGRRSRSRSGHRAAERRTRPRRSNHPPPSRRSGTAGPLTARVRTRGRSTRGPRTTPVGTSPCSLQLHTLTANPHEPLH